MSGGLALTVIVPCFNEEDNLADCLASAAFAEDILVVDSFSTDRTLEIVGVVGNVRDGGGSNVRPAVYVSQR